jgi:flavin reductase (DIM6/NTAB) family NADH-FMN oxidoreductase RutF
MRLVGSGRRTAPLAVVSPEVIIVREGPAGGIDAEQFKRAFRHHPAGVALVTADAGDGPVALTASSVASVSAEPPVLTMSISGATSSAATLTRADTLVVHLLGADELDLALLGAHRGVDRFADTSAWSRLPTGEPYFVAVGARLRGRVVERMTFGDSTVLAVHVLDAVLPDAADRGDGLVYLDRAWHRIGAESRLL